MKAQEELGGGGAREATTARRVADAAIVLIVVSLAAQTTLKILRGGFGGNDAGDRFFVPITVLGMSLYAIIGRLIVRRQPRNTIGWLLVAIPLVGALALANGEYATRTLVIDPGSLPFGLVSAWIDRWAIVVALAMFVPIFLVYPDGRLPSPRWRWVMVATIAAPTFTIVAFALTPGPLTGSFADLGSVHITNPLGIASAKALIGRLTGIGGFATLLTAVSAGVAIVVRYRRADPEVRQQIRWLRVVAVAFFAEFVAGAVLGDHSEVGATVIFSLIFLTLFVGIPVACGIAILKYRLYDLDVVVRKTVVLAIVAATITAVYAIVAVGVPLAIRGSSSDGGFDALPLAAAAAVALAFDPVRRRARRLADRLVLGDRATPYEVLSSFGERVGDTYATDDVLPRMARLLAQGTGADATTVWLRVAGELRPEASWPIELIRGPMAAPVDALPPFPGEDAFEIRDRGELLGAITLRMPVSDPMDPSKSKLVRDLTAQAGLVLRNVRLIQDLRASRQRLVAAQDEERRRIERNIHDGAQQQLVALAVKLRLADAMAERDTAKTRELLRQLQAAAQEALVDLRDLARGIYPPLLADQGLAAALQAQARKAAVPVTVHADGIGRYPQQVETAVYFCSLEALNNVAKYAAATTAEVRLAQEGAHLSFVVRDDGAGFDASRTGYGTGLRGMADRLEAIGGDLTVESVPGQGTVVRGRVRVDAED